VVQPAKKKQKQKQKQKTETELKRQKRRKKANETKFALFCSFIQFPLRVFLSFNDASFYNFVFLASFVHVCYRLIRFTHL